MPFRLIKFSENYKFNWRNLPFEAVQDADLNCSIGPKPSNLLAPFCSSANGVKRKTGPPTGPASGGEEEAEDEQEEVGLHRRLRRVFLKSYGGPKATALFFASWVQALGPANPEPAANCHRASQYRKVRAAPCPEKGGDPGRRGRPPAAPPLEPRRPPILAKRLNESKPTTLFPAINPASGHLSLWQGRHSVQRATFERESWQNAPALKCGKRGGLETSMEPVILKNYLQSRKYKHLQLMYCKSCCFGDQVCCPGPWRLPLQNTATPHTNCCTS